MPWLSVATFLPLAGVAAILSVRGDRAARAIALATTLAVCAITGVLFSGGSAGPEAFEWVPSIGAWYRLQADGVSLSLGFLTGILMVVAVLCSWTSIKKSVRGYFATFLILETGMLGVFFAYDLFLFYVFWEAALIPMYFLIGVWGGPRRIYASVKFVIFTVAGSVLMLVAILYLYAHVLSLDVNVLEKGVAVPHAEWLFLAFALAFLIKVPSVPFHTWLPDAHVEAPTAGSVILAGILLKMGVYGFIRFAIPFFPAEAVRFAPWMIGIGVAGVIYGALTAMAQHDIKKLIAYSSVSHMGFCLVGLFAGTEAARDGAILQMINHGLSTGALFALVGVVYERTHKRGIDDFGGLAKVTPRYATIFLIATLSSIGLPGLNGFIGEVLVLYGTFSGGHIAAAALAGTGVILGAIYMLRLYRAVFFGPVPLKRYEAMADLTWAETAGLVPLVALMAVLGLFPAPVLEMF